MRSIRHNLARLFTLAGRDTRGQFWPWAIAVFVLGMVLDLVLMLPLLAETMGRMFAYLQAHPEGFPPPQPGRPAFPPELMPDMSRILLPLALVQLVTVFLWFAAVVRRLHDRGRSGWWGAIVLPFRLIGLLLGPAAMRAMSAGAADPPPVSLAASLNTACYWLAFLVLIVLLAGNGTPGPNRYGDPPQP